MMGSSIHLHVNAAGKDVVLVIATVDLPEDHKFGYRYGEEVYFTSVSYTHLRPRRILSQAGHNEAPGRARL